MKITHEKLKVLNALKKGPQSWSILRMAYYVDKGEERIKSKASTSFYNQLMRMQEQGLIKKTIKGYELAEGGWTYLVDNTPQEEEKLPCGHASHEEGGPADYDEACR